MRSKREIGQEDFRRVVPESRDLTIRFARLFIFLYVSACIMLGLVHLAFGDGRSGEIIQFAIGIVCIGIPAAVAVTYFIFVDSRGIARIILIALWSVTLVLIGLAILGLIFGL